MNQQLKIIFMGAPRFGAIILEGLCQSKYKPILVVTAPDKPVGRKQILTPPPVKVIAQKYRIPVEQSERIENCKLKTKNVRSSSSRCDLIIENLKPDLVVVAAYGQILSREILEIPKYGCLNVHPSLLPKYRGPSPIQYTILNGEKETGVSIIKMTEKIDAGPILASSKFPVCAGRQIPNFKITYQELHNELAELGGELLVKTIPGWIEGKIKPKPQDESKATYTKILKRENGKINWQKSAEVLEREIRAFYPWPGSYTIWKDRNKLIKIKILKARIFKSPTKTKYPIGKVLVVPHGEEALPLLLPSLSLKARENEIGVQCGKDFLVIERLQLEGKKEVKAKDFLRGHLDFIGIILE